MRFNPPPNWPPVPPDWTPPAGWQPDPSWPPPPPGWPLWVQDNRSRRRTGLVLGAVAVLLLIVVGAVVTVAVTRDGSSAVPSATPTTTTPPSDEEQIEKVVERFQAAWNGTEYDNLRTVMCAEMKRSEEFSRANFAEMRDMMGDLNLTVTSLEITGDSAEAVIEQNGEDPDEITFSREAGEWKWCDF